MNETLDGNPNMLEETGTVVAVEGAYVVIETVPRAACGHCNVGDSCGTSVLAGLFSKRRNRVRLLNYLDLTKGEQAIVGINESVLLSAAVLAYMLPLVLMMASSLLSNYLGYGDETNFIFGMLGLFAGMQLGRRIMGSSVIKSREIVLLRKANESLVQITD